MYLGAVQAGDLRGTRERIRVAEEVLDGCPFGVATECRWGRMGQEERDAVLDVMREVAGPVG